MTGTESLDINAPEPEKSGEGGFWGKLKKGLTMTHTELLEKLEALATGQGPLDADALDDLEETLISAYLGVEASLELVESISSDVKEGRIRDSWKLRERLTDEVSVLLLDAPRPVEWDSLPEVTLVVGVNGVGKTTSIAKLAHRYQARGESVLLGAADTFRAAAIEQLGLWGERLDVPVISA